MWVNGMEVFRHAIGFNHSSHQASFIHPIAINHLLEFVHPIIFSIEISPSLLTYGENYIAVQILKHPYSASILDFSLSLLLIHTSSIRQTSPFPAVISSTDVRESWESES